MPDESVLPPLGARYRLIEEIGRGGMSVIYRARDELIGRDVAVKLLREGGDARFRSLLRAEATAYGRVNSPRVAHVYDYGETDEAVPYLVMELVDGVPLAESLADGPMPWRQAAGIGAELAAALAATHAQGLVHRDVTPGNVIRTPDGVKLIDFGISALVGSPECDEDGQVLGTAAYVAPERLTEAQVGPPSDVYALGVLLYRMLAGRSPWPDSGRTELLQAHLHEPPAPLPPLPGLPPALAHRVLGCLAKSPADRPNAADLARELPRIARHGSADTGPLRSPAPTLTDLTRPILTGLPGTTALPVTSGLAVGSFPAAAPAGRRPFRWRVPVVAGVAALAVLLFVTAWAFVGGTGSGAADASGAACSATFAMSRDGGHDFDADVSVTNTGPVNLRGWQVTFDFPGDQRLGVPSGPATVAVDRTARPAALRQSGTTVIAYGGQSLPARHSVTVPIHGRYDHLNALPTAVSLNNVRCATLVAGATSAPTPATTSATTKPAATKPAPAKPEPTKSDKPKRHGKGPR